METRLSVNKQYDYIQTAGAVPRGYTILKDRLESE